MSRSEQKSATHKKILDAAAELIRREGLAGNSVQKVMRASGLTHGGFYVHFESKEALDAAAFHEAMKSTAMAPSQMPPGTSRSTRRKHLAARYLSRSHRDHPETGCALATLLSEAGRAGEPFRQAFEAELLHALERRADAKTVPEHDMALLALAMGGLALARAVPDRALSDKILRACRDASEILADQFETRTANGNKND